MIGRQDQSSHKPTVHKTESQRARQKTEKQTERERGREGVGENERACWNIYPVSVSLSGSGGLLPAQVIKTPREPNPIRLQMLKSPL
jgi:hypothetical protein